MYRTYEPQYASGCNVKDNNFGHMGLNERKSHLRIYKSPPKWEQATSQSEPGEDY